MMEYLVIAGGIGLALAIILLVFVGRNFFKPKLSNSDAKRLNAQWEKMLQTSDSHRRLLEADIILYTTFDALGFKGSTGEKLKRAGKFLPNEQQVWNAHKLRNRLAHEHNVQLSEIEVSKALAAFRAGIDAFIR